MARSALVDGFSLAYDRSGSGPAVLLLHGWPGDRRDYRDLVPLLGNGFDVIVPDLRGFGESDKHAVDPTEHYAAAGQARSVMGLLDELGVDRAVIGGYDIGSRTAQAIAQAQPDRVTALVISPPVPGARERVLSAHAMREFWYQSFHRLDLPERLIDGRRDAVRSYLEHFWSHWSGPSYEPSPGELDALTDRYAPPGAFIASIGWYRAGSGTVERALKETVPARADRIAVPTTVLWPAHDPLFPFEWSDRLDEFFSDFTLERLPDAGHFTPLEASAAFAEAIRASAVS